MSKVVKKKGLSIEEKIARIEEWFVEHPAPYTLKELLVAVPKATGVIPQSIEECLEVLVSENRVCQKKIGINVLFWRFPKTAAQQLAAKLKGQSGGAGEMVKYLSMSVAEIKAEIAAMDKKESQICLQVEKAQHLAGSRESMREDAEQLSALQKQERALQLELEQAAFFDPEMLERVRSATEIALEAANRWTDNIFVLEQNISQRVGLNSRELREQLQLPAEIDYVAFESMPGVSAQKDKQAVLLQSAASLLCEETSSNVNDTDAAAEKEISPAAQPKNETPAISEKRRGRKRKRNDEELSTADDTEASSKVKA